MYRKRNALLIGLVLAAVVPLSACGETKVVVYPGSEDAGASGQVAPAEVNNKASVNTGRPVRKMPALVPYSPAGGAWTASLPSGSGWSAPMDSTINSRYSRTTVHGPGDATVYVDFTPADRPTVASASSRQPASLPGFPGAELVTISGGEGACSTTCFDYLLPSRIRIGGYAVLASWPSNDALAAHMAKEIAGSFIEAGE